MLILYSDSTTETEVQLSDDDINALQSKLLEDGSVLHCQNESSNPSPYSRYLHSVTVQVKKEQPVELKVDSDSLLVSGDLSGLAVLSENVASLKDTPLGYDIHVEYFDGHFYLGPNSLPVVMMHIG